ncbi:MAG TPA: DUF4254 domain-containing protein [Cyclobacteriaceae bacterium]|jgi:hypothetical protein
MLNADQCYEIFQRAIDEYHQSDQVDAPFRNPFPEGSLQHVLYKKNWIDTVQWHLEDLIRQPDIDPAGGMLLKRRIDKSNQERTDTVERIDDFFVAEFKGVVAGPSARINSETPAWLLDRMSILMLKIYHMEEQTRREDAGADHVRLCTAKLAVLLEQKEDMKHAFDQLVEDIASGNRRFKVYRQMKMYNDASMNPVLYGQKSKS